jgi:WD40 repeat protein
VSVTSSRVAVGENNRVEIFDTHSGAKLHTITVRTALKEATPSPRFSENGAYLLLNFNESGPSATTGGRHSENSTLVYEAGSYRLLRKIDRFKYYNISPDSRYVIGMDGSGTGNDVIDMITRRRGLKVVELASGQVVMRGIQGHRGGIAAAAFSPDMRYIATGGALGELKIWEFTPQS